MQTLKEKSVSGVKWQVINKVIQKGVSVVSFAILARILEPATFGLFSLSFVLIDGIGLLKTFGIDSGLIQKKDCSEKVKDTAFLMIQLSGLIVFFICYLSAPIAGIFFKNENVVTVIRALGVVFILSCFGRISQAMLVRDMRFKLLSYIEVIASVLNSIFSVVFALITPTVWALVWAYLIKQLSMTALTVCFSPHKFKWQFDWKIAKELFHFGKFLTGVSLIWFANNNIGGVVVGKILGTTALGYLALAGAILSFMNTHFTALISNVLFPAYSTLQHDPESLKRAYLKTNKFVAMFNVPFTVANLLLAREIVLTLYGDRWLPVIPLMQLTAIANIVVPIMVSTGTIFNGCGKPEYSFRLALLNLVIRIPLVIIFTIKWGVVGNIVSALVNLAIVTPVYFYLVKKIVRFSYRELFDQFLPSIYGSCVMAIVILFFQTALHFYQPVWLTVMKIIPLVLFSLAGVVVYAVSIFLIDRSSSLEAKRMIFRFEGA